MDDPMVQTARMSNAMAAAKQAMRLNVAAQLMTSIHGVCLHAIGDGTGKLDKSIARCAAEACWEAAGILMEVAGLK